MPLVVWVLAIALIAPIAILFGWWVLLPIAVSAVCSYFVFRNTLNKVQAVGRLYWIVRDSYSAFTPYVGIGFMYETDFPWRHGTGIQFRVPRRTIQIGLCRKNLNLNETTGALAALKGRFMDTDPKEIGEWK